MTTRISQAQLESYLWGAATLLRGTIDAGEYKSFIFPLLFLKRTSDVYDEEYTAALDESGGDRAYAELPEQHRFQIPSGAHWDDLRQASSNVGRAITRAMRDIERTNHRLEGVFGDAPWTNKERLPDSTLKELIEHYSEVDLSLANVPEDELGLAYEFLMRAEFLNGKMFVSIDEVQAAHDSWVHIYNHERPISRSGRCHPSSASGWRCPDQARPR